MAESIEDKIESILLISIQQGIIDIIDTVNKGNMEYKLVIGGGRGIEFYLSGRLQNKLQDAGIYDKSFDYDMYVYPRQEPTQDKVYFYHPSFLLYEDYTYDQRGFFRKHDVQPISPYNWTPHQRLFQTIREYYSDHNAGGRYHRDDIISALYFLNRNNPLINIEKFEGLLKNGEAFIQEMLIIGKTVVWRVKIHVPLINGNYQNIELIDLKNSLRSVQRNALNQVILFNKDGHQDPHGRYIKTNDKKRELHGRGGYWEYNNRSDLRSTCIIAHPSIKGKYGKDIYIPRPSILVRDNSLLIGNEQDGEFILGQEYRRIFSTIAGILGISEHDKTQIRFPFTMDAAYKRLAKSDPKYTSKYKKRFVRVFCLAYMFNHLYEPNENIFPHWNIQQMSLEKSVTFFNNQILSYAGTRFTLETRGKPFIMINGKQFPYAYDIFNSGHVPTYLSKPSLIDAHAIAYTSTGDQIAVQRWPPVSNIHRILIENLKRRKGRLADLTYVEGMRRVPYREVSVKWSHGAGMTANFPESFSRSFDAHLDMLTRISTTNKNFRTIFMNALRAQSNRGDINLYMRSCLYFSYNYPRESFNEGEFMSYRWGLPMSVLVEHRGNTLSWNKIENLRVDSEIYNTKFLSTTMNTYLDLDSPILYLSTVREVISKQYSLYIFKLKNKGFLYMDDMSHFPAEHEILIPAFSKFKIISRQWKIAPIFSSFDQEEISNYRQIYCITLEQIDQDYSVFSSGAVPSQLAIPNLPTSSPGQISFDQILAGGGGGGGDWGWDPAPPPNPFANWQPTYEPLKAIVIPPYRIRFLSILNDYHMFLREHFNVPSMSDLHFLRIISIFIDDLKNSKSSPTLKSPFTPVEEQGIIKLLELLTNLLEYYNASYALYRHNTAIMKSDISPELKETYKENVVKLNAMKPSIEKIKTDYPAIIDAVDTILERRSVAYESKIQLLVKNTYGNPIYYHSHPISVDFYYCVKQGINQITGFIEDIPDIETILDEIMIQKQSDLGKLQVTIRELREKYSDILTLMQNIRADKDSIFQQLPSDQYFINDVKECIKLFLRLFSVNLYQTDYIHIVALLAGEGFLIYNPRPMSIFSGQSLNSFALQFLFFAFLWMRKYIVNFLVIQRTEGLNNELEELLENTSQTRHSVKLKNAPINRQLLTERENVYAIQHLYGSVKQGFLNQANFLSGNTTIILGGTNFLILGMIISYYFMQMIFGIFQSVQGGGLGNRILKVNSLDYYIKQLNKNSSRKKRSQKHSTRHNRSLNIPETIDTLYSMYLKDFPNGQILLVEILISILIYRKSYKTIETYLKEENYTKLLSYLKTHTTKVNIDLDIFKFCLRLGIGILVEYYIRIKNKEERHSFLNHLMSAGLKEGEIDVALKQMFSADQGINPFIVNPSTINHSNPSLLAVTEEPYD